MPRSLFETIYHLFPLRQPITQPLTTCPVSNNFISSTRGVLVRPHGIYQNKNIGTEITITKQNNSKLPRCVKCVEFSVPPDTQQGRVFPANHFVTIMTKQIYNTLEPRFSCHLRHPARKWKQKTQLRDPKHAAKVERINLN